MIIERTTINTTAAGGQRFAENGPNGLYYHNYYYTAVTTTTNTTTTAFTFIYIYI